MREITPDSFSSWMHQNQPFVLDVRTEMEFQSMALPKANLIPIDVLPERIDELPAHDSTILVYCAHGVRSAHAAHFLETQGFSKVFNLQGGLAALVAFYDQNQPS